ncbi:cyclophilin type peptidyl-prolyl cis-trans isomerase [Myxococcus stipitatus DSM 14675]|uniref:Peptidyl-prolyl cis-trans isomerase n=1 Tax=Myxococcus stipitatus (strain DSM 14675 / JCM 12634 / Mx s8) TaxID=1278073 RepID=L7U2Z3_MYXSD|nr:peptidylprolyl isomerase [Myxococcus stipitatus]AGC42573.1 cyclophilin type peptidyl-prolyl cis-trans isomerase [Myxococcus stipitatus DSM 14675]
MHIRILTALLLCLTVSACKESSEKKETPSNATPPAATPTPAPKPAEPTGEWTKKAQAGQDLQATMETNQGTIVIRLFSKDAPMTVANFVGLATGEKQWSDPRTGDRMTGKSLYEGVIFHRVIPGFMIQGGDPTGTGRGDPGYRFGDEFQSGRTFDKTGLLAMANAGPNTNGSQFFITTSTPSYLNGKHTIFGEVVKGYDVVEKISNVATGPGDRPVEPVVIQKITLADAPAAGGK